MEKNDKCNMRKGGDTQKREQNKKSKDKRINERKRINKRISEGKVQNEKVEAVKTYSNRFFSDTEDKEIEYSSMEEKVTKHEDHAWKVLAHFIATELLPVAEGERILCVGSTEGVYLELKGMHDDFNFVMEDGSWKHFEFQSDDGGIIDLKRFRAYEATKSYKYQVEVTTYVIYSGKIKNPVTEFTEGINTYKVVPIIMRDYNADEILAELRRKKDEGEEITKSDLVPLGLCPLMSGESSQKERIREAFRILRETETVEKEAVRTIMAVVYTMALKFLSKEEMTEIKEEIVMSELGRMIFEDGKEEGRKVGKEEGRKEGKIEGVISTMKEFGTSWEEIWEKIKSTYELTAEKTQEYMDMYW